MEEEKIVCKVRESDTYGIKTLTLNNDLLSVRIFAGKGGDISQITYLPLGMTVLWENKEMLPCYADKDLHRERLSFYSELNTGSWQDVVPGYGVYGDVELKERPVGIAATLPWDYEVLRVGAESVSISLEVDLPVFPLHISKIVTLKKGDARLYIDETITNNGDKITAATWTQHSAFGGNFLDETVKIHFPADKIFIPSAFSKNGGREEDYIMPIDQVTMPDGAVYDLRTMREHKNDGHLVFTQKLERDYFEMYSERKKAGLRMTWDKEIYPYLRCWYQNTDNGYSIALEPCNYYCHTFDECVANKMFLFLEPGESKKSEVIFEIYQ